MWCGKAAVRLRTGCSGGWLLTPPSTRPRHLCIDTKAESPTNSKQRWQAKFEQLQAYKEKHGDCKVPQAWADNPSLGKWVSRQRVAKKRLDAGEASPGITVEQVVQLDGLGFVWQVGKPHNLVGFGQRLEQLKLYKALHGHCNVPKCSDATDPWHALGIWVNLQRSMKRKYDKGHTTPGITQQRIDALTGLGLDWNLRAPLKSWEERIAELQSFKDVHGHCNVTQSQSQSLQKWLARCRGYKRALDRGEANPKITQHQVDQLTALGVTWT